MAPAAHHDSPGKIEVGETRFRRIYRALELQVRPRRKRKVNYVRGNFIEPASQPNERWSIDFMHDRIDNGRSIRALAIIDDFTRECLALRIDYSLGSADVIREFEQIAFERKLPKTIRFDNGASLPPRHAALGSGAKCPAAFYRTRQADPERKY